MTPRRLAVTLAVLAVLGVSACSGDKPPADTAAAPTSSRTASIGGSADPSSSTGASPAATASGAATQGNPPGGGGATSGGNPTGSQATPQTSTTFTGPPPSPPPGYDNAEACQWVGFALLRMLSFDVSVTLLDDPSLTPEAAAEIRQRLLDNVNVAIGWAQEARGSTTDPALRTTLNQFISALNGIGAVVPTGTPAELANAMASPAMLDALADLEVMCP